MKIKILLGILLVIMVFLFFWFKDDEKYDFEDVTYLQDIYDLIREEHFFIANLESESILLKDKNFQVIKEIKIESNKKRVKVKSVVMEGGQIYFIIKGSVDDSQGILFVENNSVDMQGLHSLLRIGGNSYYYRTN